MAAGPKPPRPVPPPPGGRASTPYSRFIPREELQEFAAWNPNAFSGGGKPSPVSAPAAAPAAPTAAEIETAQRALRQAGYEEGYRDGIAALEGFKRSHAAQVAQQLEGWVSTLAAQFDALDRTMAEAVTRTSMKLARQVVRSEIAARPDCVAQVAAEAVNALVLAARHIRLRVHPDDHAFVALGAAETLKARGAQLMADAAIRRGGCLVESDLGLVDVRIESRWAQVAAAFGREMPWADGDGADARAVADAVADATADPGAGAAPQ